LIVDAHNDLLTELEFVHPEENSFETRWLPQLREGNVGLQVCPIFVGRSQVPEGATRQALRQASVFRIAAETRGVRMVTDKEHLTGLNSANNLGLMLSMEGADAFGTDPLLADAFWHLGVRMVSLTWNDRNAFADGTGENENGGLSRLGEELVHRLVELGFIIDLAHAGKKTFYDVLELTPESATVIVSHASCRSIYETPRNLDDEQLRALAQRGGVVGLMAHPLVVGPEDPSVSHYVDHIEHAANVMGIDHVGLGADFIQQVSRSGAIGKHGNALLPDGVKMEDAIVDLVGPADYPNLRDALESRGFSEDDRAKILGGNFLREFEAGLPTASSINS